MLTEPITILQWSFVRDDQPRSETAYAIRDETQIHTHMCYSEFNDIHSPNVPGIQEMKHLLEKAMESIDKRNLWVNPDCGLKTRDWPEVKESLKHMVEAAKSLRG